MSQQISPRVVESVVPAYSGVTPALDAAVGAIHPPLNQPYIPEYVWPVPLPEFTDTMRDDIRRSASQGAREAKTQLSTRYPKVEPEVSPAARESKKGGSDESCCTTTRLDNLENLVRKFDTGATRSADAGRPDPEGFLSPLAIARYCEYMNKNRLQPDGSIRDSDNWQKGIPLSTYMKGLWRHMQHVWTRHRGYVVDDPKAASDIEEDLCAVIFNASGYLHELLVKKQNAGHQCKFQEGLKTYRVTSQ